MLQLVICFLRLFGDFIILHILPPSRVSQLEQDDHEIEAVRMAEDMVARLRLSSGSQHIQAISQSAWQ